MSASIGAPRTQVWAVLADLEAWPSWGPENSKNRILSHGIIRREGENRVICEETERAWFMVFHHTDVYRLNAPSRLEEEILEGDLRGYFRMSLREHGTVTIVHVESEITPLKILPRIVDYLAGNRLLKAFWTDLLGQLADTVARRAHGP